MGPSTPSSRLNATGLLHAIERGKWLAIAEELVELPEADFKKVIFALQLLHQARQEERRLERPKRRTMK